MHDGRPDVLLFGANGQVGRAVLRALDSQWRVTALDRASADLNDAARLRDVVARERPDVIINAAAYTAVDGAEQEEALAHAVNATAPGILARAAHECGAAVIHYSSDYVFDGRKCAPYNETDATAPLSVYGRSKLAGDTAVAAACPRHIIIRAAWLYSTHGSNFLKTILRLAAERDELRVVVDQVGAPTSARLVADVTVLFMARMIDSETQPAPWGLYNVAPTGETSWYDYARYVLTRADAMGWPLKLRAESLTPITAGEYPVAATRPANSRLGTQKLRSALGLELPPWDADIDATLHALHPAAR